jgi:hypothetical protein
MHRRTLRALLATGVASLCLTSPAMAGQVTISGTADTTACTIFDDTVNHPGCDASTLTAGQEGSPTVTAHALVKFDIAGNLPAGAQVTNAVFRIHSDDGDAGWISQYPIWLDWDAGLADWDTADGVTEWGGACCGAPHPQGPDDEGAGWFSFNVSGTVQSITSPFSPTPNGGFMVFGYGDFVAYDTPADANPPELVVDYDL